MSFLLYAAGLAGLFLADFIVAIKFPAQEITDWAVLRSLIGISAVLPLIGLDQVLVRNPASSARLLHRLAFQIPLISLAVGLFLQLSGFVPHWGYGAGIAAGSAASLALFQYFRSHHHRMLSQFSQQGWKILALLVVAWMAWTETYANLLLVGICLLFLVDVLGLLTIIKLPPAKLHPQKPEPLSGLYAIGSRFMVTGLFLALSVYAEQLIVNRLGSTEEAALYFTSATFFLFPVSFLNGYLAFLIGPYIRDNRVKFMARVHRHRVALILAALVYCIALNAAGWAAWELTSPSVGAIDHRLQALFAFSGFVRILYVMPSGYIGVFGRPKQHDVLIASQVVVMSGVVIGFFVLLRSDVPVLYATAIASAANWALRFAVSYWVMLLIEKDQEATV